MPCRGEANFDTEQLGMAMGASLTNFLSQPNGEIGMLKPVRAGMGLGRRLKFKNYFILITQSNISSSATIVFNFSISSYSARQYSRMACQLPLLFEDLLPFVPIATP
jgi:hypothetical protein